MNTCAKCKQLLSTVNFRMRTNGRAHSYCKECEAEYKREHYSKNSARIKAKAKQWREDNQERYVENNRDYYKKNREKLAEKAKSRAKKNVVVNNARKAAWAANNTEKVKKAEADYREANRDECSRRISEWKKVHRHMVRKYANARRARLINATPRWAGELDEFVASEAYDLAVRREKATGVKWHVDHVIPLLGRTVSGLHVWNNLAVITESENVRKQAKFNADTMEVV